MSLNLYFLSLPFKAKMESLGHYCNPSHGISLLSVLNEQRLKGQLCDVVLVVGDQQYQAHKNVLAACSEYFQSVFSRRDAENHSIVQLDFCEPDAFEIVLNYIYSSSLFVEKCSLAAIQELGYSLGIPFLTNIMSVRPQASYSVSRKRMSLSEEEDGASQRELLLYIKVKVSSLAWMCFRGKVRLFRENRLNRLQSHPRSHTISVIRANPQDMSDQMKKSPTVPPTAEVHIKTETMVIADPSSPHQHPYWDIELNTDRNLWGRN